MDKYENSAEQSPYQSTESVSAIGKSNSKSGNTLWTLGAIMPLLFNLGVKFRTATLTAGGMGGGAYESGYLVGYVGSAIIFPLIIFLPFMLFKKFRNYRSFIQIFFFTTLFFTSISLLTLSGKTTNKTNPGGNSYDTPDSSKRARP